MLPVFQLFLYGDSKTGQSLFGRNQFLELKLKQINIISLKKLDSISVVRWKSQWNDIWKKKYLLSAQLVKIISINSESPLEKRFFFWPFLLDRFLQAVILTLVAKATMFQLIYTQAFFSNILRILNRIFQKMLSNTIGTKRRLENTSAKMWS